MALSHLHSAESSVVTKCILRGTGNAGLGSPRMHSPRINANTAMLHSRQSLTPRGSQSPRKSPRMSGLTPRKTSAEALAAAMRAGPRSILKSRITAGEDVEAGSAAGVRPYMPKSLATQAACGYLRNALTDSAAVHGPFPCLPGPRCIKKLPGLVIKQHVPVQKR